MTNFHQNAMNEVHKALKINKCVVCLLQRGEGKTITYL